VSALTLRLLEESTISAQLLTWASAHLFTVESFLSFNERYPQWVESPPRNLPSSLTAAAGRPSEEIPDTFVETANRWMAATMARHQLADRRYWRQIISELRRLRNDNILMAEGSPV
jgi:hypothetical protein